MKRVKGKMLVIGAVAVVALTMSVATLLVRGLPQGPRPEGHPTPLPEGPEWLDLLDPAHVAGWKNVTAADRSSRRRMRPFSDAPCAAPSSAFA